MFIEQVKTWQAKRETEKCIEALCIYNHIFYIWHLTYLRLQQLLNLNALIINYFNMKKRSLILVLMIFVLTAGPAVAQIGVGTTAPDSSAVLDIESTTAGFLPPRMTIAERDAISNPAPGLMIFITDIPCAQVNDGTRLEPVWTCISGPGGAIPGTISSLDNCASPSPSGTITNGVPANVTVDIDYSNGDGGAYPMQSVASTGVTGLTAMLEAGSLQTGSGSVTYTIIGTAASSGTASFAISLGGQTCTFDVTVQ
jgi:hypothetical protein